MKWTLYLFIFTLVACSQLAGRSGRTPAGKVEERHVVFDIDWTLVGEIKNPGKSTLKNKRVINVLGTHYFVNEGVEEIIAEMLSRKDIKISFYSGGKRERNIELLSKIKLKNGKSLKDIAYKILNKEDLHVVEGIAENARFAEKLKKDLSKISKNLDQLIMLDDTVNFVLDINENQTDHVFHIGEAFEYFEKFEDTRGLSGQYVPKNYNEWLLDRKKMYILNGAFKDAYAEAETGEISFSEAMKKREVMLDLQGHKWNEFSSAYYKAFSGKEVVKPAPALLNCQQMAKAIMGL